jgi:hypothetical protein
MSKSIENYKIAKYFPLKNGKYEVKPGLFSLDTDFGNKDKDSLVFQLDQEFSYYRNNKLDAHNEHLSKYFCTNNFSPTQQQYLTQYLLNTLCHEYPEFFTLSNCKNNLLLNCKLTNEELLFSTEYELIHNQEKIYTNSLDAVIMQIQEDLAIISEDDHVSCLHLMAPNFWSAPDKIGNSFSDIHNDVAGIETIIKNSKNIIQTMIHKGPYVRFAWGICSDNKLNHYTSLSDNLTNNTYKSKPGRTFNSQNSDIFLRVERQTITGMPDIKSAMFTIRTYLYNINVLTKKEIQCIIDAIESMTSKQLEYKGLNSTKHSIIDWLFLRL